jgi:predicted  nucleic acid-binding Zn-ribbon protein
MPHQCTDCGRTFEDGSKDMLSGCPDCGGNKFQYKPEGFDESSPSAEEPPEPPEPPVDSSVARTVGNAATAVRDFVGSGSSPPDPPESPTDAGGPEASPESTDTVEDTPPGTVAEDAAQASARTEVVPLDELPSSPETATATVGSAPPVEEESDESAESETAERDRPALEELRKELNDQFESIRIIEPGQYELNLMELYDREEYIIALQEDGKYTIQVPEHWED